MAESVIEYLEKNKDEFLQMREACGIDEAVGLGSLPRYHVYSQWGALIPIKVRDGKRMIKQMTFVGTINNFVPLRPKDINNIVVMPSGKSDQHLVSVYPKRGCMEGGGLEQRMLDAGRDVFCGLVSHELAEYWLNFDKDNIPLEFREKLDTIYSPSDDVREQSKADVLGSLYGYQQQVLAFLNLHLDCLKTYEDFPGGLVRPPHETIKELEDRIRIVKRY
jgi:hypothetical protein